MRQHERTNERTRMPVIALTASVMAEDRRAALMAGMDGFAIKPLDVPRLFEEIALVLDLPEQPAPSTLSAAPAPRASDEPSIIDWAKGAALWGNEANMANAVEQFLDTACEKFSVLAQAGGDIDWEQAAFSLHSLRGVAGNLTLAALAAKTTAIEALVKEGRHDEASLLMPGLHRQLDAVRQAIAAHCPAPVIAPAPSLPSDLSASMRSLLDTLARNELDDDVLESVCGGLESSSRRAQARTLRQAADAFEFAQAHALLQKLIDEHEVPQEAVSGVDSP
jgi:CheY-like chemotaxis protein